MKVSADQLKMAIERAKNVVHGYKSGDVSMDVVMTTADPGTGQMVDTIQITASAPVEGDKEDKVVTITVEIYPELEKQEPRATKTEVFTVRNNYGS